MILPGHLNKLFEIFPLDQALVVDLRSPADYDKSHIHGAINLRAPAAFISSATFDLIEKALPDNSSTASFNKWYTSKCVVFYDKCVEFAWECPTAEALLLKFKGKGWNGRGFILKGHYHEFAVSYDKYVAGQKMSDDAKSYVENLKKHTLGKQVFVPQDLSRVDVLAPGQKEHQQQYSDWLKVLEGEDKVMSTELAPAVRSEREEAMVRNQKALEDEFERRLPSLYRKAMDLDAERSWDRTASLVEPLSRGLEKMQQAERAGGGVSSYPGYVDKLGEQQSAEDYDLIDPDEELPQKLPGGRSAEESASETVASIAGGDPQKKGRGRNLLKMLRSGR
jgi:hypothetical protein